MRFARLKRWLVILAMVLGVAISVGGGGTYVALAVTTRPQFCRTCHNMEPYYQSWANSGHKDVSCVECHYEPGLLETFEGKFKALSQLAKYVTSTEGTKPWAEVSDASCLRAGCHSERMLEGEVQFGRIRFDHRHHLVDLRRGKKLRCTSCHSQIVQGEHLTVTKSTCILCHFRESEGSRSVNSCEVCHGPPKDEIDLGGFVFRHADYLKRGVGCDSCHGDVTRGTGDVPRERCGSCHNEQAHIDRYGDTEFLHQQHVRDHSVNCLQCHTEIEHSLPPRSKHYQGDCKSCHVGAHDAPTSVYRGTGGRNVKDNPGVMFKARVTCTGCHRPPYPGAPVPPGGTTHKADPLACLDCHGPGYKGMSAHWQAEVDVTVKNVKAVLDELYEGLGEEWEEGDIPAARVHYESAAHNLGLVMLDRSRGAHNLLFVRDLLRKAADDGRAGLKALDPGSAPDAIRVGPRISSKEGCTLLCHTGIENMTVATARGLPFSHPAHLLKAKKDCSACHKSEPHGTTVVTRENCVSCHHEAEEPVACGKCHIDQAGLFTREAEGASMRDLDCLACHETLADGHSAEAVREACNGCHDDKPQGYIQAWMNSATEPLAAVEARLAGAKQELAAEIRAELESLRRAGPFHNVSYVRLRAAQLLKRLERIEESK